MGDHVLGDENNAQLVEYLRFLRRKRDSAIAEVAADFKDVRESRLFEETYSVEEVEAILDGLLGVVRSTMKRDLQATSFSSVLLLKQCFEQAERASTSLSTNVPATEDMGLLRAVEDWDQNVHGSSGAAPPLRARAAMDARPSSSRALPLIGQTQDPKLLADLQNTRDDNASLQERPALYHLALALAFALSLRRIPQPHPIPFSLDLDLSPIPAERFQRLQVQCSAVLREKTAMQSQIEAMTQAAAERSGVSEEADMLRAQVEQLQVELEAANEELAHRPAGGESNNSMQVESLMRELEQERDASHNLSLELDAARAEVQGRLERSAQFVNLRQMLQKKNTVVRQLRDTLQQHGIYIDDVDATDD